MELQTLPIIHSDLANLFSEIKDFPFIEFKAKYQEHKTECNTRYQREHGRGEISFFSVVFDAKVEIEKLEYLLEQGHQLTDLEPKKVLEKLYSPIANNKNSGRYRLNTELLGLFKKQNYQFSPIEDDKSYEIFRLVYLFDSNNTVQDVFSYIDSIIPLDDLMARNNSRCLYYRVLNHFDSIQRYFDAKRYWGEDYQLHSRTLEVLEELIARGYKHNLESQENLPRECLSLGSEAVAKLLIDSNVYDILNKELTVQDLIESYNQNSCKSNAPIYKLFLPNLTNSEAYIEILNKVYERTDSSLFEYMVTNGVDCNIEIGSLPIIADAVSTGRTRIASVLAPLVNDVSYVFPDGVRLVDQMLKTKGFKNAAKTLQKRGAISAEDELYSENVTDVASLIKTQIIPNLEPWQNVLFEFVESLGKAEQEAMFELIKSANSASGAPSNKFLKTASKHIDTIGLLPVTQFLINMAISVREKSEIGSDFNYKDYQSAFVVHWEYCDDDEARDINTSVKYALTIKNSHIVKGLLWIGCLIEDQSLAREYRKTGKLMLSKVPGVGPRNSLVGNACIYALCEMSNDIGLKEVAIIRATEKYNRAIKSIDGVLKKVAKKQGVTVEQLEDRMITDYDMTSVGELDYVFDKEWRVELKVGPGTKVTTLYINETTSKETKSAPSALTKTHKAAVKEFKETASDIQKALVARSVLIEGFYLENTVLTLKQFIDDYINHNFIGSIARNLIWNLSRGDESTNVMFSKGDWVDAKQTKVDVTKWEEVRLWHPIYSDADEVLRWRDYVIAKQITQPIKQSFREVYAITEAEIASGDRSQRYANHIINHNIFHALAIQRRWKQMKGGGYDGGSENQAYKEVTSHGISVDFEATGLDEYDFTDGGMYAACGTGSVSYYNSEGRMQLVDVPDVVFSECMRDVDLFVGVCSVALDDTWRDRAYQYWGSHGFGELTEIAKSRYDVIERILPALKNNERLSLDGKFLKVTGKHRTYKIHLGSSNILMEPNDSYLCIVPKSESKVMLPFEGDRTLGLILSKAMLLLNDIKIKDQTILSQIGLIGQELQQEELNEGVE